MGALLLCFDGAFFADWSGMLLDLDLLGLGGAGCDKVLVVPCPWAMNP